MRYTHRYQCIYLINIPEPMQYHIYAMAFPFDLRCESVTCYSYITSRSRISLLLHEIKGDPTVKLVELHIRDEDDFFVSIVKLDKKAQVVLNQSAMLLASAEGWCISSFLSLKSI